MDATDLIISSHDDKIDAYDLINDFINIYDKYRQILKK